MIPDGSIVLAWILHPILVWSYDLAPPVSCWWRASTYSLRLNGGARNSLIVAQYKRLSSSE